MKYTANAIAPSAECCFATGKSTGGFSPGRTFGPVVSGPDGVGAGGGDVERGTLVGATVGVGRALVRLGVGAGVGVADRSPSPDPEHAVSVPAINPIATTLRIRA